MKTSKFSPSDILIKINLSPDKMYGHWDHCEPKVCEFQYGSTMIYISYNDEKPMNDRLAVAQATIAAAFSEVASALAFARQISEKLDPDFWKNANKISLKQDPLIVFAVRYPIDSDLPIYEISWNPSFEPEFGVLLSDDWLEEDVQVESLPDNRHVIDVKRLGAERYVQVT